MKKFIMCTLISAIIVCLLSGADLAADKALLQDSLIRLHVVGASNDEADQSVKLQVRDAVIAYLEPRLSDAEDRNQALALLHQNLEEIEILSNHVLQSAGYTDTVTVSLGEEAFPMREYDTFALPAGIYESLRIEIGAAEGRNWWCVVFPNLCLGVFDDAAAGAGFSEELENTLTRSEGYQIRFFFLDCLGMVENFFSRK